MFVNEALKGQPSIGGFEPFEMVDVRDAAELHVRSLLKEEAGGERITVSGHNYCYQDLRESLKVYSQDPILSYNPFCSRHCPRHFSQRSRCAQRYPWVREDQGLREDI